MLTLNYGTQVQYDFGQATIVMNPSNNIFNHIKVSELDDDDIYSNITGSNRARLAGELILEQKFQKTLTVPTWKIVEDDADVPNPLPPMPTSITINPGDSKHYYFPDKVLVVGYTEFDFARYFISRTGEDGSWFEITGRNSILVQGNVYFHIGTKDDTKTLNVSPSINTADRYRTILDFTITYGSSASNESPITSITYDEDTASLTVVSETDEEIIDLKALRDGEGGHISTDTFPEDLSLQEFEDLVEALPKGGTYYYTNTNDPADEAVYVAFRNKATTKAIEVDVIEMVTFNYSEL